VGDGSGLVAVGGRTVVEVMPESKRTTDSSHRRLSLSTIND
jgi:hypothetical protein